MTTTALYRGKDKKTSKWCYGSYLKLDKTTYCFAEDYAAHPDNTEHFIVCDEMSDWGLPNKHTMIEVSPDTICRSTGLVDKYGNSIFEHDYVRTIFGRICEVVWFSSPQHCGWDLSPIANLKCAAPAERSMWSSEWLTMLGNKFDNPELMEDGK